LQKATSASIFTDKARLLQGESTENISHLSRKIVDIQVNREKLQDEVVKLEESIVERQAGTIDN